MDRIKILLSWNEDHEPFVVIKYNNKLPHEVEGRNLEFANKVARYACITELDGEVLLSSEYKPLYNDDVNFLYDKNYFIAGSLPGPSSVINTISDIIAAAYNKKVNATVLLEENGKLPIDCNSEYDLCNGKDARKEVFKEILDRIYSKEAMSKETSLKK